MSKKILVIDDSQTTLQFVTETLTEDGHMVKTAKDIWVAPLVNELKPDLILMDVNISSSSKGTMAVGALKKLKVIQEHSVVILHSSLTSRELKSLAFTCGADGYMCKTNDPKTLKEQVKEFLAKKK